jgi:hypothetical protein
MGIMTAFFGKIEDARSLAQIVVETVRQHDPPFQQFVSRNLSD